MPGTIDATIAIMFKPVFPDTNPCGKLFNEFLNNEPVLERYTKIGEVVLSHYDSRSILLPSTPNDIIHFYLEKGKVCSIDYSTTSLEIYNEMRNYLDARYKRNKFGRYSSLLYFSFTYGTVFASVRHISGDNFIWIRKI